MKPVKKKIEGWETWTATYTFDELQWILNIHGVYRRRPKKQAALKKDLEAYIAKLAPPKTLLEESEEV